jgi:hypothetical protein
VRGLGEGGERRRKWSKLELERLVMFAGGGKGL